MVPQLRPIVGPQQFGNLFFEFDRLFRRDRLVFLRRSIDGFDPRFQLGERFGRQRLGTPRIELVDRRLPFMEQFPRREASLQRPGFQPLRDRMGRDGAMLEQPMNGRLAGHGIAILKLREEPIPKFFGRRIVAGELLAAQKDGFAVLVQPGDQLVRFEKAVLRSDDAAVHGLNLHGGERFHAGPLRDLRLIVDVDHGERPVFQDGGDLRIFEDLQLLLAPRAPIGGEEDEDAGPPLRRVGHRLPEILEPLDLIFRFHRGQSIFGRFVRHAVESGFQRRWRRFLFIIGECGCCHAAEQQGEAKSEIRNPKSEGIPKCGNPKRSWFRFGFENSIFLRISDFGFRISMLHRFGSSPCRIFGQYDSNSKWGLFS